MLKSRKFSSKIPIKLFFNRNLCNAESTSSELNLHFFFVRRLALHQSRALNFPILESFTRFIKIRVSKNGLKTCITLISRHIFLVLIWVKMMIKRYSKHDAKKEDIQNTFFRDLFLTFFLLWYLAC